MAKAAKSAAKRQQRAKKSSAAPDGVRVVAVDVPADLSGEDLDMYWENCFADMIGAERPCPAFPLSKRDEPKN